MRKLRIKKLRHKQRGAGMIFFAFFIPIMMILIVLIGDVGQIVYEKIRMQQTVDEATFAAANIQAIGLNEIADLNRAAAEEYERALAIMSSTIWYDRSVAMQAVNYFTEIFEWIEFYREDANERFAELAKIYASEVMAMNLPEAAEAQLVHIEPVEGASNDYLIDYEVIEAEISYSYYTSSCMYCYTYAPGWQDPTPPDRYNLNRYGAIYNIADRTSPSTETFTISLFWLKMTPPVTYAAYKLEQSEKRFLIGQNMLADLYPNLIVFASAKPTQGDLINFGAEYVAISKHLQFHAPNPEIELLELIDH